MDMELELASVRKISKYTTCHIFEATIPVGTWILCNPSTRHVLSEYIRIDREMQTPKRSTVSNFFRYIMQTHFSEEKVPDAQSTVPIEKFCLRHD